MKEGVGQGGKKQEEEKGLAELGFSGGRVLFHRREKSG